MERTIAVEPHISTRVNINEGNSSGLASSRMARTASITRLTRECLERVAVDDGTVMPRASSSSLTPIIEVQSPG